MTRKPLGRGLGALIENSVQTTEDDSGTGYRSVPVEQIVSSPFQPRRHFDAERLHELVEAIKSQGIIEPLIVRALGTNQGRFELIAGERRWRAAQQAGLLHVPVVVRELDDRAALEMSLVENLAREDLNPVDEARGLARLAQEFSLSHEETARRIGKSRPYVSNAIRLLDLAEDVQIMIEKGLLTAGQVRPLLSLASAQAQFEAAQKILNEGISARGAEAIASKQRTSGAGTPARADAHLQSLADSLQRALKRKVRVFKKRGKSPGRIEIEFYNDDDLTALADLLVRPSAGRSDISAS